MLFKRIDKCWQNAEGHRETDVDFLLEENDWDDFGYATTYHLHASRKLTGNSPEYLGSLRIMRLGQTTNEVYLLDKLFKNNPFSELPHGFVSLSMDIDMYMGVNRWLQTTGERKEFVRALKLILGENSEYYTQEVAEDDCFNKSLLRDSPGLDNFALQKGAALLEGAEVYYDLRKESITVNFLHVGQPVELHFSCIADEDDERLPNGVVVFIGKNGSGKSTAIYRLAKLMYMDPTRRSLLSNKIGYLVPNNVGVSKMFLISYSPFDNFVLPTSYDKDYIKLLKTGDDVNSRFVFSGIRDILAEEAELEINVETDQQQLEEMLRDRRAQTNLKDITVLAEEFAMAMDRLNDHIDERYQLWNGMYNRCRQLLPTLFRDIEEIPIAAGREDLKERFLSLSTGHKFFLHSYIRLLAYLDDNSLVLFDEPENHLHPPMLSFLMSEIRILLKKYHSVMFIATHSPVVLQETFANNVFVVRKDGETVNITQPRIETYGASISAITSEVFDLTTGITKYHDAMHYLYDKWDMKSEPNLDTMLTQFSERLGHQLSDQMEAYLINLYAEDNDVED